MKLTKIASLVMTSATVLSTVAVATPAIIQAKTQEGNAKMNGGKALPDTNHSRVGITFGKGSGSNPGGGGNNPDNPGGGTNPGGGGNNPGGGTNPGGGGNNPDNPGGGTNPGGGGNTNKPDDGVGYLRLQYVPAVLDFGSHTAFNSANPVFTAAGTNLNNTTNDTNKGYAGGANQTPKLSTTADHLDYVNGKTWVTVVDKQDSRTDTDAKNDRHPGGWQLSVKADGPLTTGKDADAKTIAGATLAFNNTEIASTTDVFGLTGSVADKGYISNGAIYPTVTKNLTVNLAADSTAVQVGTVSDSSAGGAYVFAWDPSDIKLTLPASASVEDGTYTTSLTWTLSTGIK